MIFKNKKSIALFFSSLFSIFAFSGEFEQNQTNPGIEAITNISIKGSMEKIVKLVKAGELKNLRVVYANSKSNEEERKIVEENRKTFQKYEKEREKAERAVIRNEIPDEIPYYTYKIKREDVSNGKGFNQIASSLDQKQGTLATINSFSSPDSVKEGTIVILPLMQGLYIAEKPANDFEILLKKEYEAEIKSQEEKKAPKRNIKKVEIAGKKYDYLPGKSISPTAKAFFDSQKQNDKMILPLSRKVLTSPFGYRTSPISGEWKLHAGIDLAAPIGTEVFACKSGTVLESGFNSIYGNYIILKHQDKKTSTYAHLSERLVSKNQQVLTGTLIGKVGNTGASTGPHLHFEIRENGKATDPTKFIK